MEWKGGVQSVRHQSTNSLYLCCLLNALLFFLTMFPHEMALYREIREKRRV